MLLEVRDFLSIKYARLETDLNHAIIAGRNGCGKSQFINAVVGASTGDAGSDGGALVRPHFAQVRNFPGLRNVVFYPPQRIIDDFRGHAVSHHPDHTSASAIGQWSLPRSTFEDALWKSDYPVSWCVKADVDYRGPAGLAFGGPDFQRLSRRASANDATLSQYRRFQAALERLVGKPVLPAFDLPDDAQQTHSTGGPGTTGERTFPFGDLSSGEKHLAVLLADVSMCAPGTLLVIDEVERHLHPSLQDRLLDELLWLLPEQSFLLVTTHSPAVLLSSTPDALWWMNDASTADGANQLRPVNGSLSLTTAVFQLYAGCSTAGSVPETLVLAQDEAFGSFIDQCYELPRVELYEGGRDSDPQVASIRESVVTLLHEVNQVVHYVDFGCGVGRCLRAFEHLPLAWKRRLYLHLVDFDRESLNKALARIPGEDGFAGVQVHPDISRVDTVEYVAAANVFHEITGERFVETFASVWNRLAPGGTLHILEQGELLVGERGFLTICRDGYRAFFDALPNASPLVYAHYSHGGIELIAARAKRTDDCDVSTETVRGAYLTALRVTKAHCLEVLDEGIKAQRRAFWLENLASVVRTVEELGEVDAGGRQVSSSKR